MQGYLDRADAGRRRVSQEFRVSPARISQLRLELIESWNQLQDVPEDAAVVVW
jgi:hypothetical protein